MISFILTFAFLSTSSFAQDLKPDFFRQFSLVNGNVYEKSPELKAWVDQKNSETRAKLDQYPLTADIKARNTELAPTNPPVRYVANGKEVFLKAGSLVIRENNLDRILVDKTSLNGSVVSDFRVSPDFKKILFASLLNGGDSIYWSVYDLENNLVLTDGTNRVRIYDVNWGLDSKGYYYSKWPELAEEYKMVQTQVQRQKGPDVAYHLLGTSVAEDKIIFDSWIKSADYIVNEVPDRQLWIAHRTKLGFTHRLSMFLGKKNKSGQIKWNNLERGTKTLGRFVTATKNWVYALSSEPGNNYGVVAYSVNRPGKKKVLIKADPDLILTQAQNINGYLVAQYFDSQFKNYLVTFDLNGNEIHRIRLEDLGLNARGTLPQVLTGGPSADKATFVYSSTEKAPVTISYDPRLKEAVVLKNEKEVAFNGSEIETQVHRFKSFDQVDIPIQIFLKKNQAPKFVYLYYYGSNGVLNTSGFNRKFQLMLELGGAVALVGARGGSEEGAAWYEQAMSDRTKSIKDVVWASRWLKSSFPSIEDRVVAAGRSYGGMLSYAVLTQYPQDFKIVVPIVGIGDLNYYLNDYHGSIGWDDLGFPRDEGGQIIDSPAVRQSINEWSPLLNLPKMIDCPSVMAFTADSDERVGPHQTYLMTYLLQQKFPTKSIFMFEQAKNGHNARAEAVDEAAFVAQEFGLTELSPLK